MIRRLLLLALLLAPIPASAQSLFSARGLGVPVDPVDARARTLGGIGVGLVGLNPSLVNPAETWSARRGVTAMLQPSWHRLAIDDAEGEVSASRFPMVGILYPATPRLTIGVSYAGYLEQSWAVRTTGEVVLGDVVVPVEDVVSSTGGVGQIRLAAAYALAPSLAVGAAGGVLTGNLVRTASREFTDATGTLRKFDTRLRWEYGGWFGGLGFRWDPAPGLRVAASAAITTELSADSAEGGAASRSYDYGLQLAAGASGHITEDLVVALGGARNRYPGIEGLAQRGRDTWTFGGGLEYVGLSTGRRTFPLRVGLRSQELPYHEVGEEPATERAAMVGLGFRLAGDESGPLAVVDLGLERARRSGLEGGALANGMEEDVWRMTLSLALFGR